MKKTIIVLFASFSLFSCTENQRARKFGGTENIDLPKNCQFLSATWKKDDLWICYVDKTTGINYLKEVSSWGVLEGTVIIKDPSVETDKPTWGFTK